MINTIWCYLFDVAFCSGNHLVLNITLMSSANMDYIFVHKDSIDLRYMYMYIT